MRIFGKLLAVLLSLGLLGGLASAGVVVYALWHYGKDLPEYKQLADYEPPTVTRVHAGDGRLIAEYFREHRIFVPESAMPRLLTQAFIAAEDQSFYEHPGVDFIALTRAMVTNVKNVINNRRLIGASTITQQVAKNFLLTNEVSVERKIREAILAFRLEKVLSKDRILELYLNEIYLGRGAYGVAAASLTYFNKSLDEMSIAEMAYLAALPKAPNNYHPVRKYEAALARRNWVIGRMEEEGFISKIDAALSRNEPLISEEYNEEALVEAGYFVEEVRRELGDLYGVNGVNEGGFSVRTTLDSSLQAHADRALRDGLIAYDRRHGYRGPFASETPETDWQDAFKKDKRPALDEKWVLARIQTVEKNSATVMIEDGRLGTIPIGEMRWARKALEDQKRGGAVRKAADVVTAGDVIAVEEVFETTPAEEDKKPEPYPDNTFALRQIPDVEGGLIALDPHTGRVLAMSGGWSFEKSEYNRATQANRQPGSAFKPFVYLAGLDQGYTPATMILDAPFVLDQGPGLKKWKPSNYSRKFYGPSPMRIGIEKSRNLMTVRLAQAIGMEQVSDYASRFNITEDMPEQLSMSLGAGETTLMNITMAYGMLVNGGKRVTPTLIDRVQDRHGKTIFSHDQRVCEACQSGPWNGQEMPKLADERETVTDPASAYQIVTMLEGVVKRGTGRRINALGKSLGGKTGTTNDSRDAWFVGFSPDLAVGVYIGFDNPKPLGRQPWGGQETGSSVAAPVFKDFMEQALKSRPDVPFRSPGNIRMARIDRNTGLPASGSSQSVILEAFKPGTEPGLDQQAVFIGGGTDRGTKAGDETPVKTGLGEATGQGLY